MPTLTIILIVLMILLLAGNIFLVFTVSKKFKELKEIREIDSTQGVDMHTPLHSLTVVEFGKKDLQVKTFKCRIIVLKRFVESKGRMSMQEYLINRVCNEELCDFLMENTDFIRFEQSENTCTDEVYFDVGLNIVKPNQFIER